MGPRTTTAGPTRRSWPRRWRLALVVVAAIGLAACSGSDGGRDAATDTAVGVGEQSAGDTGEDAALGGADDRAGDGQAQAPDESAPDVAGGEDSGDIDATAGRDLVYRVAIGLSSDDPDETVRQVRERATTAGGFVSGTQLQRDDDGLLSGTITIRVPAANLSDFVDDVSETAAQVVSNEQTVEDVTGQVADVAARLRNLNAVEQELLVLLTEAREGGDTDDVLAVFDRIGQVRNEIEVLEGRRDDLDDRVALSTVTVRVDPSPSLVASATSVPDADRPLPWSPGNVAAGAWDDTVAALQGLVDVLIRGVVFLLPVGLFVLSPVLAALAVRAWWRRRGGPGDDDHDTVGGGPAGQGGTDRGVAPARPDQAGVADVADGSDASEAAGPEASEGPEADDRDGPRVAAGTGGRQA